MHSSGQSNAQQRVLSLLKSLPCWLLCLLAALTLQENCVHAQRSLGIDISAWQGNLSQRTWNRLHSNDNQDFVFIRSSRGGTTGYYNQSDSDNSDGLNVLSQRYDDPYFVQNITRATNSGLLAGAYHFSRPDIIASTPGSGGIENTGTDEADHFIQMAGAWMRPGYLLPVHDFEAGNGARSSNAMAQFAIDFSDRIYEEMGFRPSIYAGNNYTHHVLGNASSSLQQQVVAAYPNLWIPRWPNQGNPGSIPIQTAHPKDYTSTVYGPWDNPPNPTHPWSFWQYASTGQLSSYGGNLDVNVAQGGMEFLKDHLVPALWTTASDGNWTTLTNWNSGQTPIAPVQGPGQVPRVGSLTLPAVRLPTANDIVILDRTDTDVTVTLASGNHEIRKLIVRETLDITGGSLTLNYTPVAESTPYSAQFSAPVSLSGGTLSAHTILVDAAQTFSLAGTLAVDTLQLTPHSTTPANIAVTGDVEFEPLDGSNAAITLASGSGNSGFIDLGGATRDWNINAGSISVDVPINNGGLTKSGLGMLALSGANTYEGDTTVEQGVLELANSTLHDVADVYLTNVGALNLDFAGVDVVDSLFIDGVSQLAGTWGGIGSGADFTSPLIEGTGLLQVSTFESPLVGDFNNDGSVDALDLAQWQGDFGLNADSDANNDGDSDGSDLLAWQRNFGASNNALAAQSIPEPSTAFLLLLGTAIAARRGLRFMPR